MQTAIINGKPTVYLTPVTPVPVINPSDYASAFVGIATEMIAETESQQHTNCPDCQAEMVNWRLDNPTASEGDATEAHHQIWEGCPSCRAEYAEWSSEFDAHLCSQFDAEIEEMKALGEGYLIGLNTNRDDAWQAGGEI